MDLLAFFRERSKAASSAELREMREKLSVVGAEARVAEFEAARRKALIGGSDQEVDQIEKDIDRANRDVERTVAAIEELTVRIAAAEECERCDEIERRAATARKDWETLKQCYLAIHKKQTELADLLFKVKELEERLRLYCAFVDENGRSDLKVDSPLQKLVELITAERKAARLWPEVPAIPRPISNIVLPGYWPQNKEHHHLCRLREVSL